MLSVVLAVLLVAQTVTPTAPPTPPPLNAPASPLPAATPPASLSPTPAASPASTVSPAPAVSPTPAGPTLTVSSNAVSLNPAQQRVISVSGASPPLQATIDNKLVNVTVDPNATSVTIAATQAVGTDVLHLVDANGARADVNIRVAFNAGTIVPQATLKVTGTPIDPAWLARKVAELVARLTQSQPGTQTTFGTVQQPATAPQPGAQTQFVVPVAIGGNDAFFPAQGTTTVDVQNVPLQPFDPSLLFYDDDPEHVTADGVLFRSTVDPNDASRIYYYHDDAADPRRIVVVITNPWSTPVSMQTVEASAGPNIDVMQVGNAVTRSFLLTKVRDQGIIYDLDPGSSIVLKELAMTPRQGIAGTMDFRILSGGSVTVTVLAVSPGANPLAFLGQPPLPGDGHHRTGVFRISGFGNDNLSFAAGGPDARVVMGDREPTPPNADPDATGHDYGDYGVVHNIAFSLSNPGPAPVTAYLYFKPLGGVARGSFLVDGNLVDIGCARVPVPYQISSFDLIPGQNSRVTVQTMTDGGSFLPIEVGMSATAPQPSTPPVSAPDGCFPKPQPPAVVGTPSPSASPLPRAPASAAPAPPPSPSPSPSPSPQASPAISGTSQP